MNPLNMHQPSAIAAVTAGIIHRSPIPEIKDLSEQRYILRIQQKKLETEAAASLFCNTQSQSHLHLPHPLEANDLKYSNISLNHTQPSCYCYLNVPAQQLPQFSCTPHASSIPIPHGNSCSCFESTGISHCPQNNHIISTRNSMRGIQEQPFLGYQHSPCMRNCQCSRICPIDEINFEGKCMNISNHYQTHINQSQQAGQQTNLSSRILFSPDGFQQMKSREISPCQGISCYHNPPTQNHPFDSLNSQFLIPQSRSYSQTISNNNNSSLRSHSQEMNHSLIFSPTSANYKNIRYSTNNQNSISSNNTSYHQSTDVINSNNQAIIKKVVPLSRISLNSLCKQQSNQSQTLLLSPGIPTNIPQQPSNYLFQTTPAGGASSTRITNTSNINNSSCNPVFEVHSSKQSRSYDPISFKQQLNTEDPKNFNNSCHLKLSQQLTQTSMTGSNHALDTESGIGTSSSTFNSSNKNNKSMQNMWSAQSSQLVSSPFSGYLEQPENNHNKSQLSYSQENHPRGRSKESPIPPQNTAGTSSPSPAPKANYADMQLQFIKQLAPTYNSNALYSQQIKKNLFSQALSQNNIRGVSPENTNNKQVESQQVCPQFQIQFSQFQERYPAPMNNQSQNNTKPIQKQSNQLTQGIQSQSYLQGNQGSQLYRDTNIGPVSAPSCDIQTIQKQKNDDKQHLPLKQPGVKEAIDPSQSSYNKLPIHQINQSQQQQQYQFSLASPAQGSYQQILSNPSRCSPRPIVSKTSIVSESLKGQIYVPNTMSSKTPRVVPQNQLLTANTTTAIPYAQMTGLSEDPSKSFLDSKKQAGKQEQQYQQQQFPIQLYPTADNYFDSFDAKYVVKKQSKFIETSSIGQTLPQKQLPTKKVSQKQQRNTPTDPSEEGNLSVPSNQFFNQKQSKQVPGQKQMNITIEDNNSKKKSSFAETSSSIAKHIQPVAAQLKQATANNRQQQQSTIQNSRPLNQGYLQTIGSNSHHQLQQQHGISSYLQDENISTENSQNIQIDTKPTDLLKNNSTISNPTVIQCMPCNKSVLKNKQNQLKEEQQQQQIIQQQQKQIIVKETSKNDAKAERRVSNIVQKTGNTFKNTSSFIMPNLVFS